MSATGTIKDEISGRTFAVEIGKNVCLNLNAFQSLGALDSLDNDLLRLASYVYAADLAIKRLEREKHMRSISLTVPVANAHAFGRNKEMLEEALTTLTCDNWSLDFTETENIAPASNQKWSSSGNSVLMFSGGLDSFAGAARLLQSEPKTTLVSHVTRNRPVKVAQTELATSIEREFPGKSKHLQIRVSLRNLPFFPFPSDDDREDTQRARSFLFTSLSSIAARLTRTERIVVMAENGQFAIHLPLTEARAGAFSTHTAHPKFLALMQQIVRVLFACKDITITNPFLYVTKGEVVGSIPNALRGDATKSVSCWRASRVPTKYSHCGECVPCICRRVAMEGNGIRTREYERDLLKENIGNLPPDDRGKRNLMDLCQFVSLFAGPNKVNSDLEISYRFPELFDPNIERTKAIAMYRRSSLETLNVFKNYPKLNTLLQ